MKNKYYFIIMIVLLSFFTIGITSETYARCLKCEIDEDHDNCTSKTSWYTEPPSNYHFRNCCCGERIESHAPSWGSWTKYSSSSTQHRRKCSKCTMYDYQSHTFSSTITKAATCTSTGTKTYICTVCGYSYEETIEKTGHTWGSYEANGVNGHRRKCTVCGTYEATVAHTFSTLAPSASTANSHSRVCNVCNYEKDIATHTMEVYEYGKRANGSYYHSFKCTGCGAYFENNKDCTFTSEVLKVATCTDTGTRKYTCTVCGQSYTETIAKIAHDWSGWQVSKTEHWKICNYGCGTETSRGAHVDTSPVNGICDTCNYVMYIAPIANISSDVVVKEGETATFSATTSQGTQPLTYQWYYKTSPTGTGTAVSGATSATYRVTTTKAMNGRYYYCIVSNPAGSSTTKTALLTVYYTFTLGTQPKNVNLKKGETATFKVSIGTAGNPNSYTYQWYVASSITGTGSRIANATTNSYSVTPTKNIHEEYYYCVVSNGQYSVTSNRAKLVADITEPNITMGTFEQNVTINNKGVLVIPFVVSDTGEGYTDNFTGSDIIVKVGGVTNTSATKTMSYKGASGNNYNYELTITNITGNGSLSFEVPAMAVEDNFHNTNTAKTFPTKVIIDNIAPVINFNSVTGTLNGKYINAEDKITIRLSILEAIGMDENEFTVDDIVVKVGGTQANASIVKTLNFLLKSGNNYVYELTLNNIQGDGELSLEIPSSKVKDSAGNYNITTNLSIKGGTGNVIVDNTKPVINSLVTTLGNYNNTSRNYPASLEARHNNWSNENIYVQINATDNREIDYYMKSIGNNTSYVKISSHQEILSNSVEAVIYYRVVDMAGNYAEISKTIKLDKITPNKPVMSLFEQRQNGAIYVFDANKPTDKSIYVIPNASTIVDTGSVQSGIEKNKNYTYYTITRYEDMTKAVQVGTPTTYAWNEGVLLNESGYYEIMIAMTDIAGNSVLGDIFKVYIDKKAENTIRISNIVDVGSGIKQVTIRIYKADELGNKTSEQVVEPIIIEEPYKEIIKNVRLGQGKFYVEITLEDKVGLETVLKKVITNIL